MFIGHMMLLRQPSVPRSAAGMSIQLFSQVNACSASSVVWPATFRPPCAMLRYFIASADRFGK